MSNVFSFDGYSEFAEWCEKNGYDPDVMYDQQEESHKRDILLCFYVKNEERNTYAAVSVDTNYDNGWGYGDVYQQGLTRKVTQVMTEKVEYVK